MEIKKYDSYKDSGIEWLGLIPSNWDIQRLAYNGEFLKGRGVSRADLTEEGVPVVLYGDIYTKYNLKTNSIVRKTSKKVAEKSVRIFEGDLLFTASGETKIDIGKCIVFNQNIEAYASGDVVIYRQNKFDSTFLSYLFNSYYLNINKAKLSKGEIVVHIYASQLRNIHFGSPSLSEQTQIANYLDHKTTAIDQLIEKKEKLITLLQEERTAMINQAVTKGLDPNVPMKDSGIECLSADQAGLGEIPEHWILSKVKTVTDKIGSGVTPRGGAEVYKTSGIPLLRSQNVYFEGLRLDNVAYISEDIHNTMSNSKVFKGDVLLNITGGSIGRCYFISDEFKEANVNQHVCILRPNENVNTLYLNYLISSRIGQFQIDFCQTGGNREAVNFEDLKNFLIPLPKLDEQNKISSYIQKEQTRIDAIIEKSQKEIELLQEYKTALISEVVTGKVKVF